AKIGFTVGAGWRMRLAAPNIEPTIRYTRWGRDPWQTFVGPRFNRDQLEFVAGIAGPPSSNGIGVFGRRLRPGIVGGSGLTGDFPAAGEFSSSRSKLVGISLEAPVSRATSIEVDGIYHPLIMSESLRETVLTWNFPILAKYRLSERVVRPFVELG